MKTVKEKEICKKYEKGNQLTLIKLLFNTKATKHRYVLAREECTVGFCGSFFYKEGTFRKKSDALEAFEKFYRDFAS